MHDISYPIAIINDVPVITTPDEIDLTTADQLRMTILQAATYGRTTVVVDMTGTRFCDSAGLNVLVRAHKRALADGGELRVVIPADGGVSRVFTLTRLDRFIPRFDSLDEALLERPAAVVLPLKRRRSPGLPRIPRQARGPEAGGSAGG